MSLDIDRHPIRTLDGAYFPLNYAWIKGYSLFFEIEDEIDGWFVSNAFDAAALAQMIVNVGDGDHLEIGTAWGGSSILAALIKQHYGIGGKVVTFDPIVGQDVVLNRERSLNAILKNFRRFGVSKKIEMLPYSFDVAHVPDRHFVSCLLDGSHLYPDISRDLKMAQQIVDRYILLHDYDQAHQGIIQAVDENKEGWRIVHLSGTSLIMEHKP